MHRIVATVIAGLLAAPVLAAEHETGDAAAGEKDFRKCKACHEIVADNGDVIVKGGKTGPNLYGVIGRPVAGTDFNYGDSIVAVGETGAVWDFDNFTAYVEDPSAWLEEQLDDSSARSKMAFKLRSGGDDIYAYLVSVSGE
ncbi:c-type cytochrome [Marinibacterium profundimaris]|uniref:Cytochrome C550 n=1 Tax=Marinibacterium profundimaris TaxID=1679460 RepID=A0A225NNG2_9RHOB|nr:cytochrome C [Marinibacterium profundimaris]OWU75902.1 cytochrome C550 [Marinibacterium profundimaris]